VAGSFIGINRRQKQGAEDLVIQEIGKWVIERFGQITKSPNPQIEENPGRGMSAGCPDIRESGNNEG
jgi:hypothetical protein